MPSAKIQISRSGKRMARGASSLGRPKLRHYDTSGREHHLLKDSHYTLKGKSDLLILGSNSAEKNLKSHSVEQLYTNQKPGTETTKYGS